MSTREALTKAREARVQELAALAGGHHYRDVLGNYEISPYYKHVGCTCGWERDIAGMSGWRSWIAAHDEHVAEAILAAGYKRERDHVAEQDELRKQVRG